MTTLTETTVVRLRPLAYRHDDPEWIVGSVDSGDFVALPAIAVEAMRLLDEGQPIDAVRAQLRGRHDRDIDVAGFVQGLIDLGFVSQVDDAAVAGPPPMRSSLPWLRPGHVRWLTRAPVAAVLGVLVVAALVSLPGVVPHYGDLLWGPHSGLVLLGNAAIAWSIIYLHELAHLATARAAGVPGRMGLGTRLQFLAAQTDVSGVWAVDRRARMTVYLAGIAVNVAVAAGAILFRVTAGPDTTAGRLLAATAMLSLVLIVPQFLLFMRTDLYFVLQDLTGSRNLYGDGSAYVVSRLRRSATDPSAALPANERRAVHAYAIVLVIGTMLSLAVAVTVTLPFGWTLLTRAAATLVGDDGWLARADAAAALGVTASYWTVWCLVWHRRHGGRLRALLRRPSPERR